ncbi:MAG: GTP-binding protein [Chitinophagales bacterium]|nr:GTP-binding protein [Chitinophagales bacterium]
MISRKVLITGSFAVGKTSLFRRFIHNEFSEKYLTTIGVKVDKKELVIDDTPISLVLWDIAGEISQEKVPRTYFLGASAVIYVFDLTRPRTQINMEQDIQLLQQLLPGCIIKIIGNKKDLMDDVDLLTIESVRTPDFFTSAKTGENVPELFETIAQELLSNQ